MKKLLILALLLAAGLTAYPQSSSRSSESKSKTSSTVSKSSRSSANKAKSSSNSAATKARSSSSEKSGKSRAVQSGSSSRSKVESGSSASSRSKVQSGASSSGRTKVQSGSSGRSGNTKAVESRTNRSLEGRSTSSASRSDQVRSGSSSSSGNQAVKARSTSTRTERIEPRSSADRTQSSVKSSSSTRQGNKVYVRTDGREYRHQNDDVFATRKYKVDYRNEDELRRSSDFRRVYREYERWHHHRYRRPIVVNHYHYRAPMSIEIRRVRYPYRRPVHVDLCWTPGLHHRFVYYYPMHTRWNIDYGNYIETISSYEAMNYVGSVKRVYGEVQEVYYSSDDQTYTLYFGAEFPYHDFSVVLPKRVAREITWSPSWYFENEHVWVVGLVDVWEGKPEIVIHDEDQIRRY